MLCSKGRIRERVHYVPGQVVERLYVMLRVGLISNKGVLLIPDLPNGSVYHIYSAQIFVITSLETSLWAFPAFLKARFSQILNQGLNTFCIESMYIFLASSYIAWQMMFFIYLNLYKCIL